ncbi:hypothetical protein [Jannaschia pohangensis]|uniref:Uncharacterized protein n=1 Tax=Jannaschia pohangensis TaxID=390807 RepID=A0A1I3I8M4_9RHOB|nr:hypothetical protein [Jannaschia pohangensis]SFI44286.1 hypothetical protein SAMN04488095_0859 [Jannaschia pohangensis]
MTLPPCAVLLVYILAFPLLAFLPVPAAMAAAWEVVMSGNRTLAPHIALPLAVAAAGTIAGLPMLWLGIFATRRPAIAAAPVSATVAALFGMAVLPSFPALVPDISALELLVGLAAIYLALALIPYAFGIHRLWLAHCSRLAPAAKAS